MLARRPGRARESPPPPPAAVLDDSVFALYLPVAWLGRTRAAQVTAVFPRAGRRELLAVQDLGIEPTTLNRDPADLRHITVTGGENRLVHVWLGAEGRPANGEISPRGLVAARPPARLAGRRPAP